ncbi:von Willebrand factor type A (vWA) domain-containing protein (lipase domain) [Campylobacter blaseri]|uniref:VWFA domain-containing protein n=2 Tax=Campylobacter blaseri TaxID=2042961 RepID=A0A2P8QYA1_9BACT|nr:VWA domain-containing protein [Campylobacter blaseri]PSM51237.1 hypothetical protein CQ405_08960 [Campylobacter blaseri]PSM52381.1 hypothetical protein CRN67_08965 [Campylobacter blaseri]QKF86607.1 von Willebrand factor type A (vWA) domain-containing protein (lipase domain) [Campylobacter blaseri]
MKNEFSKYKELAALANNVYYDKYHIPTGYNEEYVVQNTTSGFAATLYVKDGQKILAIRGTEFKTDFIRDLIIADGNLAVNSLPKSQYADMVKFINDNKDKLKGVTIVGHSLGGTLAQIACKSFPNLFDECYTFNAPSGKDLLNTKIYKDKNNRYFWIGNEQVNFNHYLDNKLGEALYEYQNSNSITTKVTDIVAKDGVETIANLWWKDRFGDVIEVSGNSHSIKDLTEILYFYNEMIKRGASEESVTSYLSGFYNNSSIVMQGSVAQIVEKTMNEIDEIINGNKSNKNLMDIFLSNEENNINYKIDLLNPNSLITTTPNMPELYALVNLNPFIVSNISSNAYDELEKHKYEYSKEYIKDKAKMLLKALKSSSVVGEYYKDYETGIVLKPMFDESGIVTDSLHNQFIFGTNSNDTIENIRSNSGKNTFTKIYTLAGDDTITVLGGNSHIEAGSGNDTIDLRNITNKESINEIYADNKNGKDDENGGNDTIYGSAGEDKMFGGKGFDTYYAGDKDIIEDSDGKGEVHFNNINLTGAKEKVKDKKDTYEDDKFIYKYNESSLTLKVLTKDEKQSLTIKNYKKDEKSLGINLIDKLGKEVAIVIDTTGSMGDDIQTAKNNAKLIANNIFKSNTDKNVYSKISIVTFSDNNIRTIGTYDNYASFQSGINSVNIEYGGREYHCAAMIEGMRNFTPNNGLSKEIYLMTDEGGDDNHRMNEVIAMANNFGVSLSRSLDNSNVYDNSVKINIISINSNMEHLKNYSDKTGGLYFQPNNLDELADALFDASNLGTNSNETIIGNEKDNIINGKGGNDVLQGGNGSDTYIFEANFGKNTIIETNKNNIDKNIIKFTDDTTINELSFTNKKDDLIIKKEDNQITIKDFYKNEEKISFIEFKDGKTLNYDDILTITSKDIVKFGLKDENYLNTNFKSAYLKADTNTKTHLSGGYKNDILIGENENDNIDGEFGKDILIGGKGDDKLQGGFGDDVYIYHKGDGKDIIKDSGGNDTLILKGLSKDDVELSIKNKDLVINVKDTDDNIIIKNHYRWIFGKHNEIENIIFDKDNKLDTSYINDCISSSTINKVIEQLNSYSDNNGLINITSDDIKNNTNSMQLVMSGWGS